MDDVFPFTGIRLTIGGVSAATRDIVVVLEKRAFDINPAGLSKMFPDLIFVHAAQDENGSLAFSSVGDSEKSQQATAYLRSVITKSEPNMQWHKMVVRAQIGTRGFQLVDLGTVD